MGEVQAMKTLRAGARERHEEEGRQGRGVSRAHLDSTQMEAPIAAAHSLTVEPRMLLHLRNFS